MQFGRHIDRGRVQGQVAFAALIPVGVPDLFRRQVVKLLGGDQGQAVGQFPGAVGVRLPGPFRGRDLFQAPGQMFERCREIAADRADFRVTGQQSLEEKPAFVHGKGGGKPFDGAVEPVGGIEDRLPQRTGQVGRAAAFDIAGQIEHLVAGKGEAEKSGGHILDVMGLVEDNGFVAGQDLAVSGPANGQIGKQQVVVDDQTAGWRRRPGATG